MKLNARDRAQLVIIAYETGLITPGRNAILGSDEGQRHEVGYFRHGSLLAGISMKSPAHMRNSFH